MNQKNRDGETPLLTAIKTGSSIEVIKRLLQEESVDVNCRDGEGRTPMYEASKRGNLEAVRCLLKRDDIKPDQPGWEGMQKLVTTESAVLRKEGKMSMEMAITGRVSGMYLSICTFYLNCILASY